MIWLLKLYTFNYVMYSFYYYKCKHVSINKSIYSRIHDGFWGFCGVTLGSFLFLLYCEIETYISFSLLIQYCFHHQTKSFTSDLIWFLFYCSILHIWTDSHVDVISAYCNNIRNTFWLCDNNTRLDIWRAAICTTLLISLIYNLSRQMFNLNFFTEMASQIGQLLSVRVALVEDAFHHRLDDQWPLPQPHNTINHCALIVNSLTRLAC